MRRVALVVTILLTAATSASAAPLDITNIVGGWQTAVPASNAAITNVGGQGQDQVRWPVPPDPNQSGYNFTPSVDILNVPLGTNLLLGTFQHLNQVIFSSITAVDYAFGFTTNGVPNALNDTFHFDHNETPNTGGGCCDDIVTVSSVALNQVIDVGGTQYFFNLLGFSPNGGSTFSSQFFSPEGGTNTAQLYGRVTELPVSPVPEPASIALLGVGLTGLGVVYRLRRRR